VRLSPEAQAVLGAFTEDNALHNWSQNRYKTAALAAALKALDILAYEICDGPSFRLVVDFDDIRAIAKELENQ